MAGSIELGRIISIDGLNPLPLKTFQQTWDLPRYRTAKAFANKRTRSSENTGRVPTGQLQRHYRRSVNMDG